VAWGGFLLNQSILPGREEVAGRRVHLHRDAAPSALRSRADVRNEFPHVPMSDTIIAV
jgi:hypothetical protein